MRKGNFKFENMWLDHHSSKSSFPSWWNVEVLGNWEGYQFMSKLRTLKRVSKNVESGRFWGFRNQEARMASRIHVIDALEEVTRVDKALKGRLELKLEFVELVKKETTTTSWRKKANAR